MWKQVKSWFDDVVPLRGARRRARVAAGAKVEGLELRQMLSATGGLQADIAAEVQVADQGRAVPRIDGVAGTYSLFGTPGTLTITQNGQSIQGVFAGSDPVGTFDASFKKPQSKVAKGFGTFQFAGEDFTVPVKFTIKFKPDGAGGFNFRYKYREVKAS